MKTTFSFYYKDIQLVKSLRVSGFANSLYSENDIIYFKVDDISPRVLESWNALYSTNKSLVESAVKTNSGMRINTQNKMFRVDSVFKQITFTPDKSDLGHEEEIIFEYYLSEISD